MSGSIPLEELRKLQLTGGSTYIVSLPKTWIEKMGLNRGSVVSIRQIDDFTLGIQPHTTKEGDKTRKATITIRDNETPESLVRQVVSTYLVGHNIIQVENSNERISSSIRSYLKDFTRKKLVGTETLSEMPQELTLQVLLSYSDLSVEDALRRMSIIAASMHRDALLTIGSVDSNIAREIISMDDEVDRFSLYIIRLLKAAVSDNIVLKGSGIKTSRECLGYRLITKSIERMADHAVKIAKNSLTLTLTTLNKEILEEISNLSITALKVFESAVNSLFERDYNAADKVIEEAENIRKMEAKAVNKIIKMAPTDDVPTLRLIVESLLRTAEYGADIAEIVLNMTIEEMIIET